MTTEGNKKIGELANQLVEELFSLTQREVELEAALRVAIGIIGHPDDDVTKALSTIANKRRSEDEQRTGGQNSEIQQGKGSHRGPEG